MDSGDTITIPKAGNSGGLGAISGNVYIRLKVTIDLSAVLDSQFCQKAGALSSSQYMILLFNRQNSVGVIVLCN